MLATQSRNLALKIEDDIVIELRELTKKVNAELGSSVEQEKHSRKNVLVKKAMTEKVCRVTHRLSATT